MKQRSVLAETLREETRRACLEVARTVGERVADPARFAAAARAAHEQIPTRRGSDWGGGTLAGGHAGIALLMQALEDATGETRWADAAHAHLLAASREPVHSIALYTGASGLLTAARYCARGERYAKMVATLARRIDVAAARAYAGDYRPATSVLEYDLVAGASGVAVALSDDPESVGLERVRAYLEWLFAAVEPARWACVTPGGSDAEVRLNLGVAHGCAGVAAALAMAGDRDTSSRLARFVSQYVVVNEETVRIAGTVTYPELQVRWEGRHIGWCYGNPGVALALYGVGRATGDARLVSSARDVVLSFTRMPFASLLPEDHGICHGTAGVALMLGIFAAVLCEESLRRLSARLAERVVAAFDPSLPFGYRTWVLGDAEVDSPAFLEGAAGIAVALLTLAGMAEPSWLRILGCPPTLILGDSGFPARAVPITQLDFVGQEG